MGIEITVNKGVQKSVSILFLFGENTERTINIIQTKDTSSITARYFSSERLRKDHGPVPKRTGSVAKSATSH